MADSFHTAAIWPMLKRLAKTGRGHVAVAYCQTGAFTLLPLQPGSVLVVDASLHAVKSGQTYPTELMKFVRAGVDVHTAERLHAKVFAFPGKGVVGSTNASNNSANVLQEAALVTSNRRAIADMRTFVLDQSGEQLTIAKLKRLAEQYQPPKFPIGAGQGTTPKKPKKVGRAPERAPLWIVSLVYEDWDDDVHAAAKKGRPAAKRALPRNHELHEFQTPAKKAAPMSSDAQVVQVMQHRGTRMIFPAGHVLRIEPVRTSPGEAAQAIVFLGVPAGLTEKSLIRSTPQLGAFATEMSSFEDLRRVRSAENAHTIRQLWRAR